MTTDKTTNENETVAQDFAAAGEQSLWQAVIATAIQEWLHGPLRKRREAEAYLFHDQIDFPAVCRSAGMNSDYLRSRLAKMRDRDPGLLCPQPIAA